MKVSKASLFGGHKSSSSSAPKKQTQPQTTAEKCSSKELLQLFWYMELNQWTKATERLRRHPREAKTWVTLKPKFLLVPAASARAEEKKNKLAAKNRNSRQFDGRSTGLRASSVISPSLLLLCSAVTGDPKATSHGYHVAAIGALDMLPPGAAGRVLCGRNSDPLAARLSRRDSPDKKPVGTTASEDVSPIVKKTFGFDLSSGADLAVVAPTDRPNDVDVSEATLLLHAAPPPGSSSRLRLPGSVFHAPSSTLRLPRSVFHAPSSTLRLPRSLLHTPCSSSTLLLHPLSCTPFPPKAFTLP
jgi:hypothetical protein